MEKEQFNLMVYAVAMEDYNRALTIVKELKGHYVTIKDNTLASIFEKIENAITSEKNKEYVKAKISWDAVSKSAKDVDEKISVLAKAFYYYILATSAKDIEVELEYRKKAKKEIQKSGDKILGLFASAEIAVGNPKKQAELYKKTADEFKEIGYERNYHYALGIYYYSLANATENPEEQVEWYKKSADEFEEGKLDEQYHQAMGWHYYSLANVTEKPEEGAALYKESADEFKEGEQEELYHWAMGWHYYSLANVTEKPEEGAELYKESADEFKEGNDEELYHWAMGWHYYSLANVTEKPEEGAELYKESADEFKEGNDEELYHWAMGWHYYSLANVTEKPEEGAALYKESADEFKEGKLDEQYHQAMAWHCYALANATEKPEEQAEWYRKSADEFKEGKLEEYYHQTMGWHYGALASIAESFKEQAELHKKAAEEFKEGKIEDFYHKAMAWHYYLSSLLSKDKKKIEDFKLKAVNETDWLFIANIALSKSKISRRAGEIIRFIEDAIFSYEKYLHGKGEKLPEFPIFIDGNLRDEKTVEDVTKEIRSYFIPEISPFLKNKTVEVEELDNMIENSEFILMLVENNVDEMLSFEMGLAYSIGKPVVLFVSGDISNLNPIFSKAATITQRLDYAITVLRLFSIIKSGETKFLKSVERIEIPQPKIEFKPSYTEEREKLFLKSVERIEIPQPKIEFKSSFIEEREKLAGEFKPSFIEEKKPLKQKYGRLRGDEV